MGTEEMPWPGLKSPALISAWERRKCRGPGVYLIEWHGTISMLVGNPLLNRKCPEWHEGTLKNS